MDEIVNYLIVVLFAAVSFNFYLTYRLFAFTSDSITRISTNNMPVGTTLSAFDYRFLDADKLQSKHSNSAWVLVFLDSRCAKCLEKLPLLESMLDDADQAGVEILITTLEKPSRLKKVLSGTKLLSQAIYLVPKVRFMLNPKSASPFYLFIDQELTIQANGLIDDENWNSFKNQIGSELTSQVL